MARSILDSFVEEIREWLREGLSNVEIAEKVSNEFGERTTDSSVRRLIDREESLQDAAEIRNLRSQLSLHAEAPGIKHNGDEVIITDAATWEKRPISTLSTEELLERHRLDPEEWDVKNTLVNQWEANAGDGKKIPLFQFKVWFVKKVPLSILLPAIEPLARTFKRPTVSKEPKPVVTVIETDPQAPFILKELNELAITFIEYLQPDRHVVGGDLMNLGYIGRHRDNPKWDDTVNEALQSSFDYLYHRRSIAPDMEMWLIPGNHDDRIRNEQLERNERLYGVSQAHYPDQKPGQRVYSLNHLLRLEELGINYHEPEGTYEFEFVELTPLLAVRHGHKLNASKTAPINTAMDLGHSVILGHSHSQSAVSRTVWNKITNEYEIRWAVEAGCECEIEEGLGFNKAGAPDWQPGFVTVTSFPNGKFTFDFATYHQDGALYWRDQKFTV